MGRGIGLHHLAGETLQNHNIDIGTPRAEQSVAIRTPCANHRAKNVARLLLGHKPILSCEINLLRIAFQQTENGIDGRMIEPHVGTEISLAGIHHRDGEPATHGKNEQADTDQQHNAVAQTPLQRIPQMARTTNKAHHQPPHKNRQHQRRANAQRHKPATHTGQSVGGRR